MTSKEALSKICNHIIKIDNEGFYETIGLQYADEYELIKQDLKALAIFKKHLKFKISDTPNNGSYIIFIDDFDDDYDYMCFAISEEERTILKEWLNEKGGK